MRYQRTFLFLLLCAGLLELFVSRAWALDFAWQSPTNSTAQGYVLLHWTDNNALIEQYSVGNKTNYSFTGTFGIGPNYFAVAAYEVRNGELLMSSFSNIFVATNTPAIIYEPVLFGSTNLPGTWSRIETNRLVIFPTKDCEFFKGGVRMTRTNIITLQAPN